MMMKMKIEMKSTPVNSKSANKRQRKKEIFFPYAKKNTYTYILKFYIFCIIIIIITRIFFHFIIALKISFLPSFIHLFIDCFTQATKLP
jgi:hypothetical protein